MASPRFLVGIDLGTTNTVVAYCEINDDLQHAPVSLFDIDQLIGPGEVVPVTLASRVTELGTLYLEAIAADNGQKWHVEFDVREDVNNDSNDQA